MRGPGKPASPTRAPGTTGSRPRATTSTSGCGSAYLALAAAEPERFLVLDAARPVDELATAIRDRVATLI